jgi:Flp pilus assembly protein TadB
VSFLSLILFFAVVKLLHYTFFYNYGEAYLAAMYHPDQPKNYKELLTVKVNNAVEWAMQKLGKESIDKLEKVGLEQRDYVMLAIGIPLIGLVLGSFVGTLLHLMVKTPAVLAIILAALGAVAGYIVLRVAMIIVLDDYNTQMKNGLPEFINNLKINIIAGDTMEQAFRSSAEFAWGPVEKLVTTIIRWSDGKMSFTEALEQMISQTDDTDIVSVLQRIKNYHLSGITDRSQVFEEMADDMMRISADRDEASLESLEIKLTMLMLGGMMGNVIRIGGPVGLLAFKSLLK